MSAPRLAVWPPLPPTAWFRRPRTSLPFPLGQPGCVLFSLGRHALWQGVRALGLEQGEEVLVPAYNHGSEVEALGRAGLSPRFYSGADTLEPDEAELNSLVGGRTHALLLIHYLGFPQDVARWRAWCDRHGLLLLEDAAQSWLAGRDGCAGASGDVAITCLYKTFGLPDGAAPAARRRRRPRPRLLVDQTPFDPEGPERRAAAGPRGRAPRPPGAPRGRRGTYRRGRAPRDDAGPWPRRPRP